MKTYEIEIKRTSYITLWVDAESKEQAEEKAWEDLNSNQYTEDASWEIYSIDGEEVKNDNGN
jgi:hypothetical protein